MTDVRGDTEDGVLLKDARSGTDDVTLLTRCQLEQVLPALSAASRRALTGLLTKQLPDVARLWTGLAHALCDSSDRQQLICRLPTLLPALLSRLVAAADTPPDVLYPTLADTVRLLPQLAGCVENTLRGAATDDPPWTCLLPARSQQSVGEHAELGGHAKRRRRAEVDECQLLGALLTLAFRFPVLVRSRWRWSSYVSLMNINSVRCDEQLRWLCARTLAVVSNMSPVQRKQLIEKCRISRDNDVLYAMRFFPVCDSLPAKPVQAVNHGSGAHVLLTSRDVVGDLVCVEGVMLPVADPSRQSPGPLVSVVCVRAALRSLSLAVSSGRPALLQGPVGCGKTSLVHHLAARTGHVGHPRLVTVQMGDQTDSKLLLGTYRCTEVPGQFVWQPGCLTQAMVDGHWLLLEDIDYAPLDVLTMLVPVLETRTLSALGQSGAISAAPGFQLFATQRLMPDGVGGGGFHKQQTSQSGLLERLWMTVSVQQLSIAEMRQVIGERWPKLDTVADRLLEVYGVMESPTTGLSTEHTIDVAQMLQKEGRMVSARDLMKWCRRIGDSFDVASSDCAYSVLQHACDMFCSALSRPELRLPLAQEIGARLGITRAQVEYLVDKHKPSLSMTHKRVQIGRASLSIQKSQTSIADIKEAKFSFTRQACLLLERVAVALRYEEPVLLVGETGVGKTSSVQLLAERTRQKLVIINMNQQSDSADLLGGFKPVGSKHIMAPLRDSFERLFKQTFDASANKKFLRNIMLLFGEHRWADMCELMLHVQKQAILRLRKKCYDDVLIEWEKLGSRLAQIKSRGSRDMSMAFAFIEGTLVKALKNGWWVLLDEINLASAETLECLSGILESWDGQLTFLESGEVQVIRRHPQFRLLACMNPATDVGKHHLPAGLRNRFTELFVDELINESDLVVLTGDYLRHLGVTGAQISGVVQFYGRIRREASAQLVDGTGHRPHYSLRTLCRALSIAARNPCGSVLRSLHEALCLSFLTQVDRASYPIIVSLIESLVVGVKNSKIVLSREIPAPSAAGYIKFEGYWVGQGDIETDVPSDYILTPSVRNNLKDMCRAVSLGQQPVLLQGQTSVGKTSLISYLAKASGNRCVRINNHEHTDLQEYVGAYGADTDGKLVFQEGILVDAMRRGYWIILDELNLAPSDVLEALNRVLDDNRQLYITETQTTVRAHKRFRLFATQNPPGQYGGRKILSRAFRNRFVELHFDDIPSTELITILHQRCHIPTSYCKKMVSVLGDLQARRRNSSVFQGKQGFITLRDLFRWAERYRLAGEQTGSYYDWEQHVADEGYIVLAGRVRKHEECEVIREVLQKHFKRTVDPANLFSLHEKTSSVTRPLLEQLYSCDAASLGFGHLVWTFNSRRLAVLLGQALRFSEPALLVGDTGCGKTTICQFLAASATRKIHIVNCHMHSESADFLGGLRPVRTRESSSTDSLFEWVDGPLIEAMRAGDHFLVDEISLADDSVLERLNSVLEPQRSLFLAEKSGGGELDMVVAGDNFRFVGTMNPAGDYGKKELSPALRNRFTEIWCPQPRAREDFVEIISHNLTLKSFDIAVKMVDFVEWFTSSDLGRRATVSIRDMLSWVTFMNVALATGGVDILQAYMHGAALVFLDSLGGQNTTVTQTLENSCAARECAMEFVSHQFASPERPFDIADSANGVVWGPMIDTDQLFGYEPFVISKGDLEAIETLEGKYSLSAPTTAENARRVLRALQLSKPILLEGSPGVGKTSLVSALARVTGRRLTRINLSDQTDVSDLFGADLPVDGGVGGEFSWRDGPLLRALKLGHWVLLDEMNLASQSVLEGLNACLDHRGEVFVPELARTFSVQSERTRIFACQNPASEGGARKSLPKSFLNRFTQVYVEPLTMQDLEHIVSTTGLQVSPLSSEVVHKMADFSCQLTTAVVHKREFGRQGGPWEFNLRDLLRWCELMACIEQGGPYHPLRYVHLIYMDRMRTEEDRLAVCGLAELVFSEVYSRPPCHLTITDVNVTVGCAQLERAVEFHPEDIDGGLCVMRSQLSVAESLINCVNMNWMAILVGSAGCGKTALVRTLAAIAGRRLHIFTMNSAIDTTELLGGFEQADQRRHLEDIVQRVLELMWSRVRVFLLLDTSDAFVQISELLRSWEQVATTSSLSDIQTTTELVEAFVKRCDLVSHLLRRLDDAACGDLLDSVRGLKDTVVRDRSVNAGGRFEWVDSTMVKALRAGDWLLIDNVNMCPASVLDRLNGLLEPGGVLEVTERGVVKGVLATVRPHPEFRLFLAMDPSHGEISRAMRNRGIEIYMDRPQMEDVVQLDLSTLLAKCHIRDVQSQESLLRLHTSLVNVPRAGGAARLQRLLQTAGLTSQLMCRGLPAPTAVLEAAVDVFVRPQTSVAVKKQLLSLFDDQLSSDVSMGSESQGDSFPLNYVSVSTFLWDVDVARARQLWSQVVPWLDSHSVSCYFKHAVLCSTRRSFQCLRNFTSSIENGAMDRIVRGVGNALETCDFGNVMPFDERQKPCAFWRNPDSEKDMIELCCKMVHVYVAVEICTEEPAEEALQRSLITDKKLKSASFLNLSLAVEKGLISASALPSPSVKFVWPVLSLVERLLITKPPPKIQALETWLDALPWYKRLYDICSQRPVASEVELWVSMFALHWNWIKDCVVAPLMAELLPGDSLAQALIANIDACLALEVGPAVLFVSNLRNYVVKPRPYDDEQSANMVEKLERLSYRFDPYLYVRPAGVTALEWPGDLTIALLTPEILKPRKQLLEACMSAYRRENNDKSFNKALSSFIPFGSICNEIENQNGDMSIVEDESVCRIPEAAIPLVEVLVRRLEASFISSFICGDALSNYSLSPEQLIEATCLAPHYVALRSVATDNGSSSLLQKRLHLDLLSSYLQLASSDPASWRWVSKLEPRHNSASLNDVDPHLYSAAISAAIANDLAGANTDSLMTTVSIGDFDQRCRHLTDVRRALWACGPALADPDLDYVLNHFKIVSQYWKDFTSTMASALGCDSSASWEELLPRMASIEGVSNDEMHLFNMAVQLMGSLQPLPNMIGLASFVVGCALIFLFARMPAIDPQEIGHLRALYCTEEISMIGTDIKAAGCMTLVTSGYRADHLISDYQLPLIRIQEQRIKDRKAVVDCDDSSNNWRPKPSLYRELKREVRNFASSLVSQNSIKRLMTVIEHGMSSTADDNTINTAVQQLKSRLKSFSKFLVDIKSRYSSYPDILTPIVSAAQLVHFGLGVLLHKLQNASLIARVPLSVDEIRPALLNLVSWDRFPLVSPYQSSMAILLQLLNSSDSPYAAEHWQLKLLGSNVAEMTTYLALTGSTDISVVSDLLDNVCDMWRTQEEKKAERLQEEESMYKNKTHCEDNDVNEEEETNRQVEAMFPDFHATFADLCQSSLDEVTVSEPTDQGRNVFNERDISKESLFEVFQMALQAYNMCVKARWLPVNLERPAANLMTPFCVRYALFGALSAEVSPLLNASDDSVLTISHQMAATFIETAVCPDNNGEFALSSGKPYDPYQDPNVSAVMTSRPVLLQLRTRVAELLSEWEDHPALLQLSDSVMRVLDLPLTSPLVKVTLGLEVILQRAQSWEEVAHRGVSLASMLEQITELVLQWRKLELDSWKTCLDSAAYRKHLSAVSWLPHLSALVEEWRKGSTSTQELNGPLRKFMESCPIGEFPVRLQMLLLFHKSLVSKGRTELSDEPHELACLFWHLHQYYSKFYKAVEEHLLCLRRPIERKVADFVKIARWNDINFWSMKDAVKRSHRMLHKHVKEFEAVLNQSVAVALVDSTDLEEDEQAKEIPILISKDYLLKGAPAKECPYPDSHRLSRLHSASSASRRICKNVYSSFALPGHVSALNEFSTSICENMTELSKLNVDGVEDKQRRSKEASHIRQRKRQALVELYRALARLGLSYRRGLIQSNDKSLHSELLLVPPISLPEGHALIHVWDDCVKYECRLVSRMIVLQNTLQQPHKEVGPQNLDRIRGFSADLMTCIVEQKTVLSKSEYHLSCVSSHLRQLSGFALCCRQESLVKFCQQTHWRSIECHLEIADKILLLCYRFKLFLSAAPDCTNTESAYTCVRRAYAKGFPLLQQGKASPECSRMVAVVEEIRADVAQIRARLQLPSVHLGQGGHPLRLVSNVQSDISSREDLKSTVERLASEMNAEKSGLYAPFQKYVINILDRLNVPIQSDSLGELKSGTLEKRFITKCESITAVIQMAIQNVSQYQIDSGVGRNMDDSDAQDDITIIQKHATDLSALLDMKTVGKRVETLIGLLMLPIDDDLVLTRISCLLFQFTRLLTQYERLCAYFLSNLISAYRVSTKLLSILLKVFSEVSFKGFCTPEDVEDSTGDSETDGVLKEITDGGFGEGQGAKDVSDKIESEDQLEGAYQPGQEPEDDANKDTKEEENGIEMSDDFNGKMQDVSEHEDKDENGSESGDEEEEDLDKQMGEVDGENQDKLDERLWGSDAEDESNESSDDIDEKGGAGKEDTQLGAKADDSDEGKQKEPRERQKVGENAFEEDEDQQTDTDHNNFPEEEQPNELNIPEGTEDVDKEAEDEPMDDIDCPGDVDQRPDYASDEENPDKNDVNSNDENETKSPEECLDEDENEDLASEGDAQRDGVENLENEPEDMQEDNEHNPSVQDTTAEDRPQPSEDAPGAARDCSNSVQTVADEEHSVSHDDQTKPMGEEAEGTGLAETSRSGHQVTEGKTREERPPTSAEDKMRKLSSRKRPGDADHQRSMARADDRLTEQRLKTVDVVEKDLSDQTDDQNTVDASNNSTYQHIKEADEQFDATTTDAATEDQAESEKNLLNRVAPDDKDDTQDDVDMLDVSDTEQEESSLEKIKPDKLNQGKDQNHQKTKSDATEVDSAVEQGCVDGDVVATASAARPAESSLHMDTAMVELSASELSSLRQELERRVDVWSRPEYVQLETDAERTWLQYETVIAPLAQDLSEQLRLILEPTQCSKLTGDYRTGKRLNMRKVIPYVASQFRKDKIWLRRTRPSRRDYQIVLAIDDSSSMSDNHSRQLAFESLALASRAFSLLEAGRLAVLSFGEETQLLRDLDQPPSTAAGAQLLQQLTFSQTQTRVAAMLDRAAMLLESHASQCAGGRRACQLLLVVSDGRGLFHEGEQTVRAAVRRIRHAGVFLLFLIVDSPLSQNSVLDHRMVRFGPQGQVLGVDSYLDSFPFPFYLVLRDINALPAVLSDALRQWFELVTGSDR